MGNFVHGNFAIYNTKSMEIAVSSTKFDKKFAEQRLTCEHDHPHYK